MIERKRMIVHSKCYLIDCYKSSRPVVVLYETIFWRSDRVAGQYPCSKGPSHFVARLTLEGTKGNICI